MIANGKEANRDDLAERQRTRVSAKRRGDSQERSPRGPLQGAGAPTLVVKLPVVDAAGVPMRRCDVRLVRSVRDPAGGHASDSDGGCVTAVVILRDVTPSRLVSLVQAVTRDNRSLSRELLGRLLPAPDGTHPDPPELLLSDREYEVLRMLADGESTRGIATRLSYSERTVKNVVRDLLVKLNCKTRAQAAALAVREGVI